MASREVVDIGITTGKLGKLESALKAKGAPTSEQRRQFVDLLNDTSRVIYPAKAKSAGATQPAEADGTASAEVNKTLLAKLAGNDFAPGDAEELCAQMKRVHILKMNLGRGQKLTDEERSKLAGEYDRLVAILHE